MKILLDENLPRKLVPALCAAGHDVDSVHTLRLDGATNGALRRRAGWPPYNALRLGGHVKYGKLGVSWFPWEWTGETPVLLFRHLLQFVWIRGQQPGWSRSESVGPFRSADSVCSAGLRRSGMAPTARLIMPEDKTMTTKTAELVGRELKWVQPHALKMEYELRDGDTVVGTLRFRSSCGTFATAETAEGSWTFKRVGFWQTRVTIRLSGTETDLAVFHNQTWSGGGTLGLPDGRRYPVNTNFWATEYEFKTAAGGRLITYRKIGGMFRMSSTVEIHAAATGIAELPWMVPLGWYLAVMLNNDQAAAGAVAVIAAG